MHSFAFDTLYRQALEERRAHICAIIEQAARQVGRDPSEVTVMAVSKTVGVGEVAAAHAAGYTCFGENRPQELEAKLEALSQDPGLANLPFHMIGNLQLNKINHVLPCKPVLIHSIASPVLAQAVSWRAKQRGMVQPVLLEVNVSGEQSKSGMTPDEVRQSAADLCALPGIEVRGLMTMAPKADPVVARETFSGLRALLDELQSFLPAKAADRLTELSMGMSEDFAEAVRQGSTIVRLGRVAFDPSFPLD